jgi:hypothetical protein
MAAPGANAEVGAGAKSALPARADIVRPAGQVCFVPIAEGLQRLLLERIALGLK